ncbi:MAG: hypothetical protein ACLSB9_26575 [Hydrogeniiclostridium mannosilyticum]
MKIRPTLDEVWRVKMIKEAIVKIVNKQDLSYDEAYAVMNEIMSGETTLHPERSFFWRRFPPRAPRLRPRTKLRAAPPPCATTPPRWTPAWISLRSLAPAATTPTASTSPPPRRWWQRQSGMKAAKHGTGPRPPSAALPTVWKRWA